MIEEASRDGSQTTTTGHGAQKCTNLLHKWFTSKWSEKRYKQIKAVAPEVLPGVKMRRSLFWRYTAVWIAPAVQ